VLDVENITSASEYRDVSSQIKESEIVGLAGLMGSGRTEIAQTIFGIKTPDNGAVRLNGKPITSTTDAITAGIALVPESHRRQGFILDHSVAENFLLSNLDVFKT
jgi:ribose transport system ATP-binding protein